ncbi:MAG TPA: hypothetical protein VGC51_06120 [Hansschlegelia sp.]
MSWLRFSLGVLASFLAVLFVMDFLCVTYTELNEPWFWAVVVCSFSAVVSVLAMSKEQDDEDRRLSGE